MDFLCGSNVNLGRLRSKTRGVFLETAAKRFDAYGGFDEKDFENSDETLPESKTAPMDDRVLCIKPKNRRRVLDAGKGVHAMTPGESALADEQLNRSPYTNRSGKKE